MIKPLPHWVLTNRYPAFYDTESVTAIEMVAKLYGSMEEMITDYNKFVDDVNAKIKEFEDGIIDDFDEFKNCVMQLMNDYISSIDTKIELQDATIADAIDYMKDNIVATATNIFNQAFEEGRIYAKLVVEYDEPTRSLTLKVQSSTDHDPIPSKDLVYDAEDESLSYE